MRRIRDRAVLERRRRGLRSRRRVVLAVLSGAAAVSALAGAEPRVAAAASVSCVKQSSLYACTLPSQPVWVGVTFDEIESAVAAAGGKISANDPAMYVTAWGGYGSNGTKCGSCAHNGGAGAASGWAQIAVSKATYIKKYGTDTLFYAVAATGPPGPEGSSGGYGGGGTVVAASPPSLSSPGQAPPFRDVVLVAGGGGGGGGGGTGYSGRDGAAGGTAQSSYAKAASSAGADEGAAKGGNHNGLGNGGAGACGKPWCAGADGVGGFGGFGWIGYITRATTGLYDPLLLPQLDPGNDWEHVPLQTPGMGGGNGDVTSLGSVQHGCGSSHPCGGGGGGGFGGGGAGPYTTKTGAAGGGGGGGGSYAAAWTCDATAVSEPSRHSPQVVVYVDPAQDCPTPVGATPARRAPRRLGNPSGPVLARVLQPRGAAISRHSRRTVRLRLARGARITRARLNGRTVKRRFRRQHGRVWAATLDRRQGVRVGENVLVVRTARGSRRWYSTIQFTRAVRRPARLVDLRLLRAQGTGLLQVRYRHGRDRTKARIRVRLNGRPLRGGHRRRLSAARESVRLSASSGLRQGTNRITVRVQARDGRLQTLTRTFRVANRSLIAGAGRDLRGHVHARLVFDGSRSLAPRAGASRCPAGGCAAAARRLTFRWRLVRRPAGSRVRLAGAHSARAALRPDTPGKYVARLTVRAPGGRVGTDTTTATVDALPNTVIDTLATSPAGVPGIELDSAWFCPDSGTDTSCMFHAIPSGDNTDVQLLVLDRDTLAVVSNTSYAASSLAQLDKAISELIDPDSGQPDSEKLVVVTLGAGAVTDVNDFSDAVVQIGALGYDSSVTSVPGPFSIIGIPGMESGKAWRNFTRQIGQGAPGELLGYFKDSAYYTASDDLETEQRVFTFPDVVGFQTVVGTGGNDGQVNLSNYDASSRSYATTQLADFASTQGGLGIVTFNPYTLAKVTSQTYVPNTPAIDWSGVGQQLQAAVSNGDGVAIVSLGKLSGFTSEPTAGAFAQEVLPAIRKLGGQPDIFARAVNDGAATYSFVSSGGQGAESSSVISAGVGAQPGSSGALPVNAGNQTGELRRGRNGRFLPSKADPSGLYQSQVLPVVYQAPIAWPDTPAAGAATAGGTETALAWIAQCRLLPAKAPVVPGAVLWDGMACDYSKATAPVTGTPSAPVVRQVALSLRADYYDNDNLDPMDVSALDYAQQFPAGNDVFTESDFDTARDQLVAETAALSTARSFVNNTKAVLTGAQVNIQGAMEQVATAISNGYFADANVSVTDYGGWANSLFEGFFTAGSTIASLYAGATIPEDLFAATGLVADLGSTFETLINGPHTSVFTDPAAWLQTEQQLRDTTAAVNDAVDNSVSLQIDGFDMTKDIVLSDWGRLDTTAANSQGVWSMDTDDELSASNAFVIATRQQIWQGYAHDLWIAASSPHTSALQWECSNTSIPIYNAFPFLEQATPGGLPTGLGQGIQYWPLQSVGTTTSSGGRNYASWQSYIMWERGSQATVPPVATVAQIFAQPQSQGADKSAGGAYGPWFWPAVFDMTRALSGCPSGTPTTSTGSFYGQTG